jgi:hypothetical protein
MKIETTILPLVVDLDGTLLKAKPIDETLSDPFRVDPLSIWKVPIKLAFSRAKLKSFLANKTLEADSWPIQGELLEYVKRQFELGRKIVLVTAADQTIADGIARHSPFISEVIASDRTRNPKGGTKANRLRERFPEGFIYAADSTAGFTA